VGAKGARLQTFCELQKKNDPNAQFPAYASRKTKISAVFQKSANKTSISYQYK